MKVIEQKLSILKKLKAGALPESLLLIASPAQMNKPKTFQIFDSAIQELILSALKLKKKEWKAGESIEIRRRIQSEPSILLACLPEEKKSFDLLEFFRKSLKVLISDETKSFGLVLIDSSPQDHRVLDCLGSALSARVFLMPVYGKKAKEQKAFQLANVSLFSNKSLKKFFDYGFEAGQGSNLVRYLGSLPPNELNPSKYGDEIKSLCRKHKIQLKFYSRAQLEKMGAGAFLAVNQGDPDSAGGIYELSYSPSKPKNKKPIALVGKGLCYDTGGYDIKTGGFMAGMKGDMQGSAVALSSLLTMARLKVPLKAKAYLGITENHISPKAYKADEVVMAMNGRSIEVVNTDAEGRMVLADVLTLATKPKPDLCIDFATLTGMAVYSIGTKYSAGFTNEDKLHSLIVDSGKESGERVWTFPLDKDFGKSLESSIADTLQCSRARGIDHILAAFFLQSFVEEGVPWVHIDLSAAENKGGLAHTDSEFTGFGVRWTLEFLKKKYRV